MRCDRRNIRLIIQFSFEQYVDGSSSTNKNSMRSTVDTIGTNDVCVCVCVCERRTARNSKISIRDSNKMPKLMN